MQKRPVERDLPPFAIIPLDLAKKASGNALKAWCSLSEFADYIEGTCYPSIPKLAKNIGVSDNTIKRGLAELKELGRLKIDVRKKGDGTNDSNLYTLVYLTGQTLPPTHPELGPGGPPISESDRSPEMGWEREQQNETQKTNEKQKESSSKSEAPFWARELADELKIHAEAEFKVKITDKQLDQWARKLDSLTRSKSFKVAPNLDQVQAVIRWGIADRQERGTWRGWSMQLRSAPDADKFAKVWKAMEDAARRPSFGPAPVSRKFQDEPTFDQEGNDVSRLP